MYRGTDKHKQMAELHVDLLQLSAVDQASVCLCRWIPLQHQIHVVGGQGDMDGPEDS